MSDNLFVELGTRYHNLQRHGREFYQMFRRPLKEFVDPVTGFDIVKFDDEIAKPSKSESVSDAVKRQWGKAGVLLVKQLISSR